MHDKHEQWQFHNTHAFLFSSFMKRTTLSRVTIALRDDTFSDQYARFDVLAQLIILCNIKSIYIYKI